MTIEKRVHDLSMNNNFKPVRFKALQARRSFVSKMYGFTDRYASYKRETGSLIEINLAFYKKPSNKSINYIWENIGQDMKRTTKVTCYFPSGETVLYIPSLWDALQRGDKGLDVTKELNQ